MYEIAICDDDSAFASDLRAMLDAMLDGRGEAHRISLYESPAALLRALESGFRCDLIFQDILFGREEGIRFARYVRQRKWDVDLVFVTSSTEYAIEGYSAYPLNYLLKPLSRERLSEVMDRFLEKRTPRVLLLSTSRGSVRLAIAEVIYFEIYDHDIRIHLAGGGTQGWTGTLKELEASLPPRCFVRPHRSYLVNLEHVAEISRGWMKLSTGDTVPISKNLYRNVQMSLVEYDDRRSSGRSHS